jgi:signal transduction histidine kinase
MQSYINTFFNKKRSEYDYRQVFLDFNRSLHTIKEKSSLISSIVTRIYELIPAKSIYMFWENNDATRYVLANPQETMPELYLLSDEGLVQWLRLNEKPLTVSFEPEFAGIYSENDTQAIQLLESVLILPLKTNHQFRGVIFLGKKENDTAYRNQDLDMLSILLDNAALAIENIIYNEEHITHLKHIVQTDRLAVIGQLAAGAAHEIRNPLTSIRSAVQYIQGDIHDPKKQLIVQSVLSEVDRINDILTGLLSFSRQNNPVKREFDLAAMIEQTVGLVKNTRIKKQITFSTRYFAPSLPIIADNNQLKQVFMNIILNAIDAIREEGLIEISVQSTKIEGLFYYSITIADNGIGIDEDSLEKLYDPFYTTKEEGTGLGLSISYGIIHRHKGYIEISNRLEGGTQVTVQLPQEIN